MLKENKHIQKGWEFNPTEVLKKSWTNSCTNSTTPLSGRFSTVSPLPLLALKVIAKLCKSSAMAGAESEVPVQAPLPWEERRKNPNLQQVTPTLIAPRRLCFYFCLLSGRIFLPLSHQPLNSFPLRHPQSNTQGIIAHQWIAHRGLSPIRSSITFCFHKALPTLPKSQWQMFPLYFFKGMKYRTKRNMKRLWNHLYLVPGWYCATQTGAIPDSVL